MDKLVEKERFWEILENAGIRIKEDGDFDLDINPCHAGAVLQGAICMYLTRICSILDKLAQFEVLHDEKEIVASQLFEWCVLKDQEQNNRKIIKEMYGINEIGLRQCFKDWDKGVTRGRVEIRRVKKNEKKN